MALLPIGPQESQERIFQDPGDYLDSAMDLGDAEESEVYLTHKRDHVSAESFDVQHQETEFAPHQLEAAGDIHTENQMPGPVPGVMPELRVSYPEPVVEDETEALPLTVDDFAALEERVLRAVGLVRRERVARSLAEERALQAEAQLAVQASLLEKVTQLEQEIDAFRQEREQVRLRVERLLSQLDALEL